MSKNKKNGNLLPLSISQNFLTKRVTIERILKLSTIKNNDYVIEIGAGKGHITKELIKVSGMVNAFEIDPKLAERLKEVLCGKGNVKLTCMDFLKANLPKERYKVFSNIPFSITSAIIRKLSEASNPPEESWLIMEKGAAKRFMGKPRETVSSLILKPFFNMEIQYYFNRQDFHPAPSVDTVLLHLVKKDNSDIPASQRREFSLFVEKGLRNGIGSLLTQRQIKTALKIAKISDIQESGEILYIQWLCLFRCYRRLNGGCR